jgi:hypothetical protein
MPVVRSGSTTIPRRDYTRLYETLGVAFSRNRSGDEAIAETCPFCGREPSKFYVNVSTGQYDCKHCGEKGNPTTFLTWLHEDCLGRTTPDQYSTLGKVRGVAPQTLRDVHQLAYCDAADCWLVPFKSSKGSVVNFQLYYPDREKPNKLNLPGLPTALYGFDRLAAADKAKPVLLCEGPFDAIALDYDIGAKHRPRYAVVATPGGFKEEWVEHFRGRKVRAFYDNDKGGEQHRERVRKLLGESGEAAELLLLKCPAGFDGCDVNDLVRRPEYRGRVLGFLLKHSFAVQAEPKLAWSHGWERKATGPEQIDWVWPDHLRCGTYVSFSGEQGTLKSTIARELVSRYTLGEMMPECDRLGLPAGHAVYVTAEDSQKDVWAHFDRLGADRDRLSVLPAVLRDGDPLNVLEHLPELEALIREQGTRLVAIDGQNSVVGAPNISTDMLARHNVTNKLHQFAQRLNVCLVGIRNEDAEGRALGPQSMGDVGRCVLRAVEEAKGADGQRYFRLVFKKVSDVSPSAYPPIPYSVEDLGGPARRILWGKSRPKDFGELKAARAAAREGRP